MESCETTAPPSDRLIWRIVLVNDSTIFCYYAFSFETKEEADAVAKSELGNKEYVLLPFLAGTYIFARTQIKNIRTSTGKKYTLPYFERTNERNMQRLQVENRKLLGNNQHLRESLNSAEKAEQDAETPYDIMMERKVMGFALVVFAISAAAAIWIFL